MPTGLDEVYPFGGLLGCLQTLLFVGTGMQDEVVEVDMVLDDILELVDVGLDVAEHVNTVVDFVVAGGVYPGGGFCPLQPDGEQDDPGHDFEQYLLMFAHHPANAKHSRDAGKPA